MIRTENLTRKFGGGRGIFDLNLEVPKGTIYGFVGHNGAGKTTTIRHIMGFAKPQKGEVKIFGKDTFGHTDKILDKVGYLPGEPAIPAGLDDWV